MKNTTITQKTLPSFLNTEINLLAYMIFLSIGSLVITAQQTAVFTMRSEISLKRDREEGIGIPYVKLGKQLGSDKVLYGIYDVAKFIVSRKSKVIS